MKFQIPEKHQGLVIASSGGQLQHHHSPIIKQCKHKISWFIKDQQTKCIEKAYFFLTLMIYKALMDP